MQEYKDRISEIATLMGEFGLNEARFETGELSIAFRRRLSRAKSPESTDAEPEYEFELAPAEEVPEAPATPAGVPITSPMTGIFYSSPSPSAPPFVKVGERVEAGQVVGLIEAMKVFNEIVSTVSGTVIQTNIESGHIVNPGDVLLYIG